MGPRTAINSTERKTHMKISNVEFDTLEGFAWATLDQDSTLQCCLVQAAWEPGQEPVFLPVIDTEDCGYDDGICGDVNQPVFDRFGEENVMKAFFQAAKNAGIELI